MNALELVLLGRRLARVGEQAIRRSGESRLPKGVALVLMDVFAHPGSSITEIAQRTGLPQGYVSEGVARLREQGAIETVKDRDDRRRTRVHVADQHAQTIAELGSAPVDEALARALGAPDGAAIEDVLAFLESIAVRLRPAEPGAIARQLSAGSAAARS